MYNVTVDDVDVLLFEDDETVYSIIKEASESIIVDGKQRWIRPTYSKVCEKLKEYIIEEIDDEEIAFDEDIDAYLLNTIEEYFDDILWYEPPKKQRKSFICVKHLDGVLYDTNMPSNIMELITQLAEPVIIDDVDYYPKPNYTKVCKELKNIIANKLNCGSEYKFTPWAEKCVLSAVEYNIDEKFVWDDEIIQKLIPA